MKTLMITAPSSGSGKTTITMGIIRAIKNMGLNVCGFKTGPDYIDMSFIETASGKSAGNLDMHLEGKDGPQRALALSNSDYCIVEGAMGYFDGIYNTYENSSYDISKTLNINAILVYSPKGEMFTAVTKIKGMAEFEDSKIKAVILNKVNENYYKLLKEQIEKYTKLKVLGYIPEIKDVSLESRHLGLIQCVEIDDIDKKIETMADSISKNINMDELLNLMKDVHSEENLKMYKKDIKVGIAMDKAFTFYYRENIRLLENTCEVIYFSPLQDEKIPDCDLLYIGGGYPEVFAKELSENKPMLKSIKDFADNGGFIYAECGGFMYLNDYIEDNKMVGIFNGNSTLTKRLQRFGYIDIKLRDDCILGRKGDKLTAHEFHTSITEINSDGVYNIAKTMGDKKWECGYTYKNVLAGYPHINFLGNYKSFNYLMEKIQNKKIAGGN